MLENIEVIIYKAAKNAMQSGVKKGKCWKIQFPADQTKYQYDLMNWTGSADTRQQLNLAFETKGQAVQFVEKNNWKYQVIEPLNKKVKPKAYADNFTS